MQGTRCADSQRAPSHLQSLGLKHRIISPRAPLMLNNIALAVGVQVYPETATSLIKRCMFQMQSKHRERAPRHPQQLLKDVRAIIAEPRVHVLIGDVLPDPLDASSRRLQLTYQATPDAAFYPDHRLCLKLHAYSCMRHEHSGMCSALPLTLCIRLGNVHAKNPNKQNRVIVIIC